MSSRQMSSAVLITLDGAAPAPVSARLMPMRIGLPLCASAPEKQANAMTKEAPRVRRALRQRFMTFPPSSVLYDLAKSNIVAVEVLRTKFSATIGLIA